mmetsp:Transcript_152557/g.277443  ORF Transcript_152557/g.277443 Transcript_152557/m.277443 type:complete len:599 (+) Transcript_152557:2-1798(+)
MPELRHVDKDVWLGIEVCCTIVFTVEYVVRLLVCTAGPEETTVYRFIKTPMNVCDLGAILPFYVSLLMSSLKIAKALGILRTVRLIRLFRIFKLGRYSSGLQLMAQALTNSSQALWVLGFFLFIGIVLFSSAIYYVEKMGCPERDALVEMQLNDGSNRTEWDLYVSECRSSSNGMSESHGLCCDEHGSPLDFPSIIEAFWWATVTMTTVGFGEVYPRTEVGRMVATATMLSGILLIALPVAIIGRKFQEAYDEHQAALQGFCDTPRTQSFSESRGSDRSPGTPVQRGVIRRGSGGNIRCSASTSTLVRQQKQQMAQQKSRDVPEGPTLSEMGRRLRLMKLPDGRMTQQAHDLAEELAEAADVQKEINSMQAFEASRQAEVVEQFDNLLKRLCDLQTGGAALARLTKSGLGGLAGLGLAKASPDKKSKERVWSSGLGPLAELAESTESHVPKEAEKPVCHSARSGTSNRSLNTEVLETAEHPCAVSRQEDEAVLPGSTPPQHSHPSPPNEGAAPHHDGRPRTSGSAPLYDSRPRTSGSPTPDHRSRPVTAASIIGVTPRMEPPSRGSSSENSLRAAPVSEPASPTSPQTHSPQTHDTLR